MIGMWMVGEDNEQGRGIRQMNLWPFLLTPKERAVQGPFCSWGVFFLLFSMSFCKHSSEAFRAAGWK